MPMFHRIRSQKHFRKVMTILGMSRPNHTTRLWLLGYLIACGYSKPEIQSLIYDSNQWKDYNEEFTEYMVTSFIPGKMPLDSLVTMEELLMDKWSTPSQPQECSVKSPMVKFADRFNRQFFWGAREMAIQYEQEKFYRNPRTANPMKVPVFRSIEGLFHVFFVADFDDPDLNENLREAMAISNHWHWDFIKYTGNKSIHMIKKLPHVGAFGGMEYSELVAIADEMEKGYGVSLDRAMFKPRQLIRGYCIHSKTGKIGCPVYLETDTAETIEARSKQFALVDK